LHGIEVAANVPDNGTRDHGCNSDILHDLVLKNLPSLKRQRRIVLHHGMMDESRWVIC
jgi:hypothetical protein